MGRFHFSIPGRKKPTSLDAFDSQALSKAHKILGSTPISIDDPAHSERASSSAVDKITTTSVDGASRHQHQHEYHPHHDLQPHPHPHPHPHHRRHNYHHNSSSDDAYLDEHVRLALSEGEGEYKDHSGTPTTSRQDLERKSRGGRGHSRLKKSQSSSAIRTRTKLQAAARHCSSQTTSSGSPFPFRDDHDSLDDSSVAFKASSSSSNSNKAKKKPAMLDLSNLRPNSRLSRGSYQSQPDSASSFSFINSIHPHHNHHNHNTKSNGSTMPSLSHSGILSSGKRSSLKRRTKESFRSLLSDASGSTSSGGMQREPPTDPGLSTLYNHYEQMSFLHVMKQGRDSDDYSALQQMKIADAQDEAEWEEAQTDQDLNWLHKPLRDPVQITARPSSTEPTTGRKSKGKKVSGRGAGGKNCHHNRAPDELGIHRNRDSQESDFHNRSVLLLSDSDSDGNKAPAHAYDANHDADFDADADADTANDSNIILLNRTYNASAQPVAKSRSGFSRSQDSAQQPNRRSPGSDHYPRRRSNRRTSDSLSGPFASADTLDVSEDTSSPFGGHHATYDPRSPSPRESLSSSDSKASMMTCQFGFGGQETPVMTILPARRPSQAELEQEAARIRASRRGASRGGESLPRSPEQLTPPLSPSSVDFFLRSGDRPSAEAPELPNRIMAVTREEKMLISALRKKNQAMREIARLGASGQLLGSGLGLQDYKSGASASSSSSKAAATGIVSPAVEPPLMEFGFHAPPSMHTQQQVFRDAEDVAESSSTGEQRAAMCFDDGTALPLSLSPTKAIHGGHKSRGLSLSYDGSDMAPSPRDRQGSSASAMYQDVLVYLDQRKASMSLCQGDGAIPVSSISDLDKPPMMRSIFDHHHHHLHHHQHQQHHQPGNPSDHFGRGGSSTGDHGHDQHSGAHLSDGSAASLRGRFHPGRIQTDNLSICTNNRQPSPSSSRLETLREQEDIEDIDLSELLPRPESPISPESFPCVPENRIVSRNRARLSAVGLAIPAHLHDSSWADDDDDDDDE